VRHKLEKIGTAWEAPCVKKFYQLLSNNGGRTRAGWQTGTQESSTSEDVPLPFHRRGARGDKH